jgi:hypothetical protein
MQYIDETLDLDTRIELIKTLNSVSAGKVWLIFMILFIYFCFLFDYLMWG